MCPDNIYCVRRKVRSADKQVDHCYQLYQAYQIHITCIRLTEVVPQYGCLSFALFIIDNKSVIFQNLLCFFAIVSNTASVKLHLKITKTSMTFDSFEKREIRPLNCERSLQLTIQTPWKFDEFSSSTKFDSTSKRLRQENVLFKRCQIYVTGSGTSLMLWLCDALPWEYVKPGCELSSVQIVQTLTTRKCLI